VGALAYQLLALAFLDASCVSEAFQCLALPLSASGLDSGLSSTSFFVPGHRVLDIPHVTFFEVHPPFDVGE
jgi:hypothetical protein